MKAFIYSDDKTSKFWTIDYSGVELCVHYGKANTIGKYEIKEFDSEQVCEKQAEKLIANKLKKGYAEDCSFDFSNCIYIDTEEFGPHRKTSHPRFSAHFCEDFYYDCADEEAPFGSDEGSDTLHELESKLRKNPDLAFSAFPEYLIQVQWGMKYIPAGALDEQVIRDLEKEHEMDMQQSDMVTYATAFGQIKTTGRINAELKKVALMSLKRFALMYNQGRLTDTQQKMYDDLQSFCEI